tara:strand:+ start:94 stop:279 length:186 start_codon:yes stop_codon:yes gene_type:complete
MGCAQTKTIAQLELEIAHERSKVSEANATIQILEGQIKKTKAEERKEIIENKMETSGLNVA